MELKEILETLVKGIVQTEDQVEIADSSGEVLHGKETTHFLIKVKKEEFSLLVGKGGSTIKALRTIMSKLAGKQKKMVFVDLDEK
ncbi:KH domain-containing protein [bacterium]|nr:KH domain-containing protein [bacterium]